MGSHSRFLAGLAALLLTVSWSLGAQPVESQPPDPDITVVVTADRVLTEITSIPAHVSIITEEEIRASGATTVVELLGRQAGISFRSFSHEAQAVADMRGFGENSQGRVLVLVDGRRQNSPDMSGINWLAVPIDSIERIEIVRGSASSLYGNNALGGVINIITKVPTQPLEVTAFGSFGSFLTNQQRLGVLHAGNRARLRSSAEHFFTDGYRDRSAYRALNFAFGTDFDATDRLTFSLGGRYANLEYEFPGSLTKAEFESDPTQAGNPADEGRENQFAVDGDVVWVGPGVRAELALGYAYKLAESDFVGFSSFSDRVTSTVSASPGVVIDWFPVGVPVRSRLGVDYQWARQDVISYLASNRNDRQDEAVLGQWMVGVSAANSIAATDRIDVTLAARYDRSDIWAEKESPSLDERKTHQAIVFDAGLVFRPVENAKVYARGGTVFRYPFIDEQAVVSLGFGTPSFDSDLKPERGFTVEVGGGLFLGRLLQAEVSTYLLQMRDPIAYDMTVFANRNLDETRRLGGDLTLSSEPIDLLRVAAGYSFVNAVFIAGDDKGNQIPLVPNHSIDAELGVRPLAGLEFGPGITYRSRAYQGGDTANTLDRVDQYLLTDLFLRYRPAGLPGDLSLSAAVKNVFDANYAPLQFYSSFSDTTGYYPAAGRSFQIAASYRY